MSDQSGRIGRMNRRKQFSLELLSAVETQELENYVARSSFIDKIWPYIPPIAWYSLFSFCCRADSVCRGLWLLTGTIFYVCNNQYDWSRAFYVSVNVGVGLNWPLPAHITNQENYENTAFKVFSSFHTAVGAIFLGSSSLYISTFKKNNQDLEWFKQPDCAEHASPARRCVTYLLQAVPHYKLVSFSVVLVVLGILWFTLCEDQWGIFDSLDYVVSSGTGSGYKGISNDSPDWQFAFAALYCAVIVPMFAITIGVSVNSYFEPSDQEKASKMFADITEQELEFMVEFGLDDGDGLIDRDEFIILMVVRIGNATPELIVRLSDRFRELNRRSTSDRIHFDDIVAGRRKITPAMRKLMFAHSGLSSMGITSFGDPVFHNRIHPYEADSDQSVESSSLVSDKQLPRNDSDLAKWSNKLKLRLNNGLSADQDCRQLPPKASPHALNREMIELMPWTRRMRQRMGSASSDVEIDRAHSQISLRLSQRDALDQEERESGKSTQHARRRVGSASSDVEIGRAHSQTSLRLSQRDASDQEERESGKSTQHARRRVGSASSDVEIDRAHSKISLRLSQRDALDQEERESGKSTQHARRRVGSASSDVEIDQAYSDVTSRVSQRETSEKDTMSWPQRAMQRMSSGSSENDRDRKQSASDLLVSRDDCCTMTWNHRSRQRSVSSEFNAMLPRIDSVMSIDTTTYSPMTAAEEDEGLEFATVRRFSFGGTDISNTVNEFEKVPSTCGGDLDGDEEPIRLCRAARPDATAKVSRNDMDTVLSPLITAAPTQCFLSGAAVPPSHEKESFPTKVEPGLSLSSRERCDDDLFLGACSARSNAQSSKSEERDIPSGVCPIDDSEAKSDLDEFESSDDPSSNKKRAPRKSKTIDAKLVMQNLRAKSSKNLLGVNPSRKFFDVSVTDVSGDEGTNAEPMPTSLSKSGRRNSVYAGQRRSSVHIDFLGREILHLKSRKWIQFYQMMSHPHLRILLACVLWLSVGTLFYHVVNREYGTSSLVHAFFTSVSAGYAMFWITVEDSPRVKMYTICHIFFGAVALGSVRAAVAHSLAESKLNWYVDALLRKEALSRRGNLSSYMCAVMKYYFPRARIHILVLLFVFFGVALSCIALGWSFPDGLYFSVGALVTAGLHPLPDNTDDWIYIVVGLFVLVGAPFVAVSVSLFAASIANIGALDRLERVVNTVITEEELQVMISLGFDSDGEFLSKNVFIMLMLIRIGALKTELLSIIMEWFNTFDTNHAGLTYETITQTHLNASTKMKKRAATVISFSA